MHIFSFQSVHIWFHQLNGLIYHHSISDTITWIFWLNISIYHHSNCGDWLLPLSLIPSDKRISIFVQTKPLSYLLIFDHHPHFVSIDIQSSAISSVWYRGAFFWGPFRSGCGRNVKRPVIGPISPNKGNLANQPRHDPLKPRKLPRKSWFSKRFARF